MKHQLENEEWLPIDGYEDLYQVSNYGRVKSLNYRNSNQEQILKPSNDKKGYQRIGLWKDRKQKWFSIHRLVASAFIPNPNSLPQVNHIDEVKTNNHVENLEWCDCKYNINYGSWIEKHSGKFGKKHHLSKQVIQLTLNNEVVKTWDSMHDIERELGFANTHISACCRGRYKSAYNYKWQYAT